MMVPSAANILSVHFKTVGSVLMVQVLYRYSSSMGVSGCKTPWRPAIVNDEPISLMQAASACVPFVGEEMDLGDSWLQATPLLIDFEGKRGGTVKLKLKRESHSIASPWLDYLSSAYHEEFEDLKGEAVEFIQEDEKAPAIAGVDEGSYAD